MKKIIIFAIALATLAVTGCKEFLDVKPQGTPTTDTYFANDSQIETAVKSIYSPLADGDDLFGRDYHWEQCVGINMVPGRTRDWPQLFCLQWNGDESPLRSVFDMCYRFGSRANWIIKALTDKEKAGETLSYVGTRSLGEAYFMRAWLSLTIASRYGTKELGVPAVQYEVAFPDTPYDYSIPPQAASVCDNYAMIVADFQEAEKYLGTIDSYSTQEKGRASKEAACAMMARTYAYWATWDAKQWDNVIATVNKLENTYGRALMPTFSEMFNDEVATWWNKEYCWSIPSNGGYNPRTGCEFPGVCLENKGWGVYNGWGQFKPSYDAFEEFLKDGDSIDHETGKAALKADGKMVNERLYRSILQYGQEFEYYGSKMKYYGDQDVETGFQINKWMEPFKHFDFVNTGYVNESGGSWPSARVNFHVIRFADALLLRAEAYLHANKAELAAKDLNAIRKRAGLVENCTGTWEELYHERVCELMFETLSDSRIDLIRWAIGEGVDTWMKNKAIACLEGHPRALFHVYRNYPGSPVGQGVDPTGNTVELGEVLIFLKDENQKVIGTDMAMRKGAEYASIETNLMDGQPAGVGPYKDYIDMNKNAKWDAHLAVFPYPSQQVSKSAGALKQNAGY
ncbi:MAG: RagB/SusD family nutrient uptake outer membrane protein [Bacteroidales bacterium]|nr:RagB/SusD family nutrient uptake outer membrane protein [Bacteroidales bacterium]